MDYVTYQGIDYLLINWEMVKQFDPHMYGLNPLNVFGRCWRGYDVYYELDEKGLVAQNMIVTDPQRNFPPVEGVLPEFKQPWWVIYRDLNIPVPYTGNLTLVKDRVDVREQKSLRKDDPIVYQVVLEFTLGEGRIASMRDRSAEMEELRKSKNLLVFKGERVAAIPVYPKEEWTCTFQQEWRRMIKRLH